MTPESRLSSALFDACSRVIGVSIQSWDDKSTWVVSYTDDATREDRAVARAVIASFNKDKPGAENVRAEAARRIEARYPVYKQLNLIRDGGPALADMSSYIDAVRAASNALEASLPIDFASDAHWPTGEQAEALASVIASFEPDAVPVGAP